MVRGEWSIPTPTSQAHVAVLLLADSQELLGRIAALSIEA